MAPLKGTTPVLPSYPSPGLRLLLEGKYRSAIRGLQQEVADDPTDDFSLGAVCSLAIARLCAGQLGKARKMFDQFAKRHPRHCAEHYIFAGIVRWFERQHREAVATWREGLKCQYVDNAGGMEIPVLLFYAAVRDPLAFSISDAGAIVKKQLRHPYASNWPGHLGKFILGRIDEEKVRRVASRVGGRYRDAIRAAQLAQVDFCAGVLEYQRGNKRGFRRYMQRCADAKGLRWTVHECILARFEIGRMKGTRSARSDHARMHTRRQSATRLRDE